MDTEKRSEVEIYIFLAISLDGFIARNNGEIDWLEKFNSDDPNEDYGFGEFFKRMDCLVMGRKSFEKVLSFQKWPYTGKPVQILSRTLTSLPAAVSSLAELTPKLSPHELLDYWVGLGWQRIYLDGGEAARSFLECGLVKQLTLTRIPIILGTGKPLFGNTLPEIILKHLHTRSIVSGLVLSDYAVV